MGLCELYSNIEIPSLWVVREIMSNGMAIDPDLFHSLAADYRAKMSEYKETIFHLARREFNINSTTQLANVLTSLNIPLHKKTKSGKLATGVEVLIPLKKRYHIISHLLEYRRMSKLVGTYLEPIPKMAVNGRVHTTLKITTPPSGRLASADPDLQNIPVRRPEGKRVRDGFVAPDGKVLLAVDLSQIEMRIEAHLAQDPTMIRIFQEGGDIHTENACRMFSITPEQVMSDELRYRYPAKGTGFGVIFGITDRGLYAKFQEDMEFEPDAPEWTVEECGKFIDYFFNAYPKIWEYIEETKAFARRHGYVVDMFNRRRFIPEVASVHKNVREAGLREAINHPAQAGAASILKLGMVECHRLIHEMELPAKMVMQIHDELLFEVDEGEEQALASVFVDALEKAYSISIPIKAEAKAGARWGCLKKL